MKILQINNNYQKIGGAEVVFHNTIKLLKEKGHEIVLMSRNSSDRHLIGKSEYFIANSKSYLNRYSSKRAMKKVLEIIENEKPDIAHVHNIVGGITFSVLPALKRKNIPIVMTIHDFRLICPAGLFLNRNNDICEKCLDKKYFHCAVNMCSTYGGLIHNIALSAESYLRNYFYPYQKLVDNFVFVSNFTKKKYFEVDDSIDYKSVTIYNFTNRFEFGSNRGDYFLYFGRLIREKGLITLLKAFNNNPSQKLKIAGEGYLRTEIERIKPQNVVLVGLQKEDALKELITNASFIIVPSECYETLSMSTLESFANGKPVIGSNIGALPELIKEGVTGFTFQPKDDVELTRLINYCSQISADKYNELTHNAFNFAQKNFSPEIYYNKLMDVYTKAMLK